MINWRDPLEEITWWKQSCGIIYVESLPWNPGCGITAVESGCGILAMEPWLWNPGGGILAMESWLWNPDCGILTVESWQWNPGFGNIWRHVLGSIWVIPWGWSDHGRLKGILVENDSNSL